MKREMNVREPLSGTVDVVGVPVEPFCEASITDAVMEWVGRPGVDVAVGVNAHVCNLARRDERLRDFLAASACYADGQSIVWSARLLGGRHEERLATTDIAEPLLAAAAEQGIPVFFLGSDVGVAEEAARRLRARIPELRVKTQHGYFGASETIEVLDAIADHETGILFVGFGDPAQQRWIAEHAEDLPPVVLTCGGLFDWLSGAQRRAPGWMIDAGLEWLWRLIREPRRLAGRYVIGNAKFLFALARQLAGRGRP
ncbi:WecB/TagA/CpsF family glycosyltransferase [Leucobacter luti]|uniref:WecB/TagA/CpsF family glycosyltransferase n=1 Tax=Leucobacter luti TaxID=340320 RepID=UPI003D0715B4